MDEGGEEARAEVLIDSKWTPVFDGALKDYPISRIVSTMSVEMAMSTSQILAENVRREMAARNWSQTELAKRCKLPQPRISEILGANFDHRLKTVDKLAKAFGTTPSALLMPVEEES